MSSMPLKSASLFWQYSSVHCYFTYFLVWVSGLTVSGDCVFDRALKTYVARLENAFKDSLLPTQYAWNVTSSDYTSSCVHVASR